MLCAPAVIVMLAVTAYPIVYAFVLSLQKLDLRFPEQAEFIGLANYGTVLSWELWWLDVWNTLVIMIISVSIELVLGMLIALVMHRAIFGRGLVRTVVLIPYGIITVVAAFAWQFAFSTAGSSRHDLRACGAPACETLGQFARRPVALPSMTVVLSLGRRSCHGDCATVPSP